MGGAARRSDAPASGVRPASLEVLLARELEAARRSVVDADRSRREAEDAAQLAAASGEVGEMAARRVDAACWAARASARQELVAALERVDTARRASC